MTISICEQGVATNHPDFCKQFVFESDDYEIADVKIAELKKGLK